MLTKIAVGVVVLVVIGVVVVRGMNTRVVQELRDEPHGERAKKVMLISVPSGKTFPVNYLRDPGVVWAAADSPWWRQMSGPGIPVTLLIQGKEIAGHARAIEDEPDLRKQVFARLRPTAPLFFGVLVKIELGQASG